MSPTWHLLIHELRRNGRNAISWTIVVAALILLYSAFLPTIIEAGDSIAAMLESWPDALLKAFNIENTAMMSQPLGYHVVESGTMILILGGIFSASLGANILLKEELDRTAEFLLSQPLLRIQIWISKTAAAVIYVAGFNAVITLISTVAVSGFSTGPVNIRALIIYHVHVLLLTVLLAAVGLLLSAAVRRGRTMTGIAVAIVLAGFFIDTVSKITDAARPLGYISPYRFVNAAVLDPNYGISIGILSYFIASTLLTMMVSAIIYQRKDIIP